MRSRCFAVAALMLALVLPTPVAAASSAQFSVTLSATTFQVGDTLTFTPVVTNAEPDEILRCEIWIERYDPPENWVRMHVSSSNCEPWTFVVPPGPLGQYEVVGRLYIGLENGQPTEHREVIHVVSLVGGGTPAPFVTNYPVQSWALDELASTSTPTFGEPMTIYPPATGNNCVFRILGGIEASYVWQRDGCVPWTFSIPERDSEVLRSIFGDGADVQVQAWSGESPYTIAPEGGFVGQIYGETYAVNLPDFVPGQTTTTEYTSNLPAIFAGRQRGRTGQSGDPTPVTIAPVVVGTTEGTCMYSAQPGATPVVPGGCEDPVIIPGSHMTGTQQGGAHLELRDSEGILLATGEVLVGWVDDMSSLEVDAPDSVGTGDETDIDASTEDGAPASYEVTAEPDPVTAPVAAAAGVGDVVGDGSALVIASGVLDPDLQSDGDAIRVTHAFGTPGRYRVTATFTDVRGGTTSGSTVIVVGGVDGVDPTVTKPKPAFGPGSTTFSGKTPVRFTWTGSDAGSGIDRYQAAISRDGGAWSTLSTNLPSAQVTDKLAAGHSYRLRVRAVDNAGNVGAWVTGNSFTVSAYQEGSSRFNWIGAWNRPTNANFWDGRERTSTAAGAKVTFTFTGRSLAWIGSIGTSRGSAKIYVDGVYLKTVSLNAAATGYRRVVASLSWSNAASRKIKIVVIGTPGHARIDLDAFVVGT